LISISRVSVLPSLTTTSNLGYSWESRDLTLYTIVISSLKAGAIMDTQQYDWIFNTSFGKKYLDWKSLIAIQDTE
jgi:hypothetical protein